MIQVYDSLQRAKVPLTPREPGHVKIYVCGVTPYAESHLGHARPAVVWDVIRRHLRRRGYRVTFVQNFTDIDDKIIARSRQLGVSAAELADRHIQQYEMVMKRLGVRPPDFSPRVTDNIATIIGFIQQLVDRGAAYSSHGDVYFRVAGDPLYGSLSGRQLKDMREGARIEPSPWKQAPEDFALWKAAEPGEPAWESPWGLGRPGWHIECSAMSCQYLGDVFDMHGGGLDLIFPHHENERAQSRAYLGHEPVALWVHNGLITRGQVKMSKSLDNGIGLTELLDRFPPEIVRTYLLTVHYRSPLDFQEDYLRDWQQAVERVWRLWDEVRTADAPRHWVQEPWMERLQSFEARFLETLDDDFNTARAFADVFDMIRDVRAGMTTPFRDDARAWGRKNLEIADEILGFLPADCAPPTEADDSSDVLLTEVLALRDDARRQRQFAWADALRDVLIKSGYDVEDTPEGTRVHQKPSGSH